MSLDENLVRLAGGANVATVVTLMPDGQPQAQLRWVDLEGDEVLVNTEPQRQAARNVRRDPRITILIRAEDNPYDWVEVRGRVVRTTSGAAAREHIDRLARKYTGGDYAMPIGAEGRVILHVVPDRLVSSGN